MAARDRVPESIRGWEMKGEDTSSHRCVCGGRETGALTRRCSKTARACYCTEADVQGLCRGF